MNKTDARKAIEHMETYQFGQKKEEHNKLSGVTSFVKKSEALNVIDQLEEPETDQYSYKKGFFAGQKDVRQHYEHISNDTETLSQEWIDEHAQGGWGEYVLIEDLQDVLVPEQEITVEQAWEVIQGEYGDEVLRNNIEYVEAMGYVVSEKPVIPEFIAEWVEKNQEAKTLSWAMVNLNANLLQVKRWKGWNVDRFGHSGHYEAQELVARAWLDGYEVEEEQKYYVLDKDSVTLLLRENSKDNYIARSTGFSIDLIESQQDKKIYQLTEQEIKDYDERFWGFAIPVEELEE